MNEGSDYSRAALNNRWPSKEQQAEVMGCLNWWRGLTVPGHTKP